MFRHGYKVRKFGRKRDQREALIKGLADSLILMESIETTLPKAKAVSRYTEKLIGQAKTAKDNLYQRRQLIKKLSTLEAAHKLVDELAPKLKKRSSGYLRIERTTLRRGDGVQMAKIMFVDELVSKDAKTKVKEEVKPKEPAAKKEAEAKEEEKPQVEQLAPEKSIDARVSEIKMAPKRAGRRVNR